MKKLIFLDFDGVMDTEWYTMQLSTRGQSTADRFGTLFVPKCIENLRFIIDKTDAYIVVTSTWKMALGLDGIQTMWQERQLPGKVIDVTPDIDAWHRGTEIQAWLDFHQNECRYAIIDDAPIDDYFNVAQLPYLFKVDGQFGLDRETSAKVIEHLNSNDK